MVSALISRFLISGVGTLYPAYRSYKDVREYVKWMMYWIVFAIFLCLEPFLDIFVCFWMPFYYEIKIIFILWLLTPYTKGASVLYRKFIHPTLNVYEEEIDLMLDQAKNGSVKTIIQLGSQGVNIAKDVVANAAIAGHSQILNQMKKSYSMGDINDPNQEGYNGPQIEEIMEEDEDEGGGGEYVGYYENGKLVEERLGDEEFEELQPRRTGLRPRRQQEEKYATLPRSSRGGRR